MFREDVDEEMVRLVGFGEVFLREMLYTWNEVTGVRRFDERPSKCRISLLSHNVAGFSSQARQSGIGFRG